MKKGFCAFAVLVFMLILGIFLQKYVKTEKTDRNSLDTLCEEAVTVFCKSDAGQMVFGMNEEEAIEVFSGGESAEFV